MRKWAMRLLRVAYVGLIAALPVAALANYTATQGAGTNFGSVVIAGVHFASGLICDFATANQCASVTASNALNVSAVDGAFTTEGAKADAACANGSSACSVNARLAHMENLLAGPQSPSSTITGSLTPVVCGSAAQTCVIANSAGHNLFSVYAECNVAVPCWLVVANSTTALTTGATTAGTASGNIRECLSIPANDQRSISYAIFPDNYSVGISAALSSTSCGSITVSATASGFFKAMIQ